MSRRTENLTAFIELSRLHFLAGGFLLFALGSLAAGDITLAHYIVGQLAVTAAQITAHYLNEYADYEADLTVANRTAFSGGSGVLVSGRLARGVALRAGHVTTVVTLVACVALLFINPLAALTVLLALAVSWAYSMPPVRLLGTGWGELFTALTVAGLVPATGALVASGSLPSSLWWMMTTLVALQFSMLLAFELPDLATDLVAGKRVLGTRIGERNTIAVVLACIGIAATLVTIGVAGNQLDTAAGWWSTLAVPPAIALAATLAASVRTRRYGLTTLAAVATFFLTAVGFTVSLITT